MRYKSIIEDNTTSALQAIVNLKNDVASGKPHVTVEYVQQVLDFIETKLDNTIQYLNIED